MKKMTACIYSALLCTACTANKVEDSVEMGDTADSLPIETDAPVVTANSTFTVLIDEDFEYAQGLAHDATSTSPFAIPLYLDVYYPDNDVTDRPVHMFIHGGGFTGGSKTKPEIVEMANYYASRGWVFASIDYRTVEELCDSEAMPPCESKLTDMTPEEMMSFYKGIVPEEWMETSMAGSENLKNLQQALAMYAAQRDAKAALRWIVGNAETYGLNKDFITVGGASAGAITTVALGISDASDFRDEISVTDDPTLSSTNLDETYDVKSLIYFWGSNIKLEVLEMAYGVNRYDSEDPELFMAHGTDDRNPTTAFSEALELQEIYGSFAIYNELVSLEGEDHGAWSAEVDGKGLFEMSFDFIVARQGLNVE